MTALRSTGRSTPGRNRRTTRSPLGCTRAARPERASLGAPASVLLRDDLAEEALQRRRHVARNILAPRAAVDQVARRTGALVDGEKYRYGRMVEAAGLELFFPRVE